MDEDHDLMTTIHVLRATYAISSSFMRLSWFFTRGNTDKRLFQRHEAGTRDRRGRQLSSEQPRTVPHPRNWVEWLIDPRVVFGTASIRPIASFSRRRTPALHTPLLGQQMDLVDNQQPAARGQRAHGVATTAACLRVTTSHFSKASPRGCGRRPLRLVSWTSPVSSLTCIPRLPSRSENLETTSCASALRGATYTALWFASCARKSSSLAARTLATSSSAPSAEAPRSSCPHPSAHKLTCFFGMRTHRGRRRTATC